MAIQDIAEKKANTIPYIAFLIVSLMLVNWISGLKAMYYATILVVVGVIIVRWDEIYQIVLNVKYGAGSGASYTGANVGIKAGVNQTFKTKSGQNSVARGAEDSII